MPRYTAVDNAVISSSDWNANIRDQVVEQCTSGTNPTGVAGQVIAETDTDTLKFHDGTAFRKIATIGNPTIEFGTNFTGAATHVVQVGNVTSSQRGIGVNADNTATRNHMTFHNPNGAVGTISTNGTATAYNTSSDERLKADLGPVAGAVDLIRRVVVRRFRWRSDDTEAVGVFAQQLHEVVPDAVTVGGDDPAVDPWQVDYSKIVPHLLAAVQELAARVEELEAR